jgi:hypothetical protein
VGVAVAAAPLPQTDRVSEPMRAWPDVVRGNGLGRVPWMELYGVT